MTMCDGPNGHSKEQLERWKRIRFVKKFLRRMPRKATIHRYPGLRRFANIARERSYLWSFRTTEVIPAFYIGWILTFMPILSIFQILLAFFAAMICRANVMILVSLQILSNPITFPFLWFVAYKTGAFTVRMMGTDGARLATLTFHEFAIMVKTFDLSKLSKIGKLFITIIPPIAFGAIILGTIIGAICSLAYKIAAKKYSKH